MKIRAWMITDSTLTTAAHCLHGHGWLKARTRAHACPGRSAPQPPHRWLRDRRVHAGCLGNPRSASNLSSSEPSPPPCRDDSVRGLGPATVSSSVSCPVLHSEVLISTCMQLEAVKRRTVRTPKTAGYSAVKEDVKKKSH